MSCGKISEVMSRETDNLMWNWGVELGWMHSGMGMEENGEFAKLKAQDDKLKGVDKVKVTEKIP